MGGYLIDGMQVRVDARLCTSLPGMKGNPEGDRPAGKGGRGQSRLVPPRSQVYWSRRVTMAASSPLRLGLPGTKHGHHCPL